MAMTLDLNGLLDSVMPAPKNPLTGQQVEIQRYYVESIVNQINQIEEEKKGGKDFKFETSDKYDKYTKAVEFVDSYRDYYKKVLKKVSGLVSYTWVSYMWCVCVCFCTWG